MFWNINLDVYLVQVLSKTAANFGEKKLNCLNALISILRIMATVSTNFFYCFSLKIGNISIESSETFFFYCSPCRILIFNSSWFQGFSIYSILVPIYLDWTLFTYYLFFLFIRPDKNLQRSNLQPSERLVPLVIIGSFSRTVLEREYL